jgi:hypothetical protein
MDTSRKAEVCSPHSDKQCLRQVDFKFRLWHRLLVALFGTDAMARAVALIGTAQCKCFG